MTERAARSGAQRVLELARRRGSQGVHQTDFDAGRVVDGGRPIRRLAARIDELRDAGHWFTTRKHQDRTVTYVLVRDAGAVSVAQREGTCPPGQAAEQLALECPPSRPGLYDQDEAA